MLKLEWPGWKLLALIVGVVGVTALTACSSPTELEVTYIDNDSFLIISRGWSFVRRWKRGSSGSRRLQFGPGTVFQALGWPKEW